MQMLNNAKAKGFWFKAFSSLGEKDSEEEGEDESRFILPVLLLVVVVTKQ